MALPPPSPSPSWVILAGEARASASDDDLPQGADLSLALAAPPRVTVLTVPPRVSPADPDPSARRKFPCVLAADPSGLLLLTTPPTRDPPDSGELRTWRDDSGVVHTFRVGLVPRPSYFVCDVSSATASPVPDLDRLIFNEDLGVIAAPGGGGHYMVAEFQFIVGGDEATLLCFSSETGEWVEKEVDNPLPHWIWTFYDVVSHGGKLWWVDFAAGLLVCDPFADEPDMEYVPLPECDVYHGCSYCSERELGTRRFVQLSNGKFRCVEMSCASHGAPKVSMQTLADTGTAEWTLEYEANFTEIWAGESYKAAGLPEKAPVLSLIHPKNPDVVYFFLEKHLFGLDLRARKVVECEAMPGEGRVSSCSVLPFELPPALSAGLSGQGTDNGVNEESSASPASAASVPTECNGGEPLASSRVYKLRVK